MIIMALMKYWLIPVPLFFLQKVDRIKNNATQIKSLFLINIPPLQSNSEIKLAPSGSYWRLSFFGSKKTTLFAFLLVMFVDDIYFKDW